MVTIFEFFVARAAKKLIKRIMDEELELQPELMEIIEFEYQNQCDNYGSVMKVDSGIFTEYQRYLLKQNRISRDAYEQIILDKFENEMENNSTGFDYGEGDFLLLYDDETTDEQFAMEMLFYMNPSFTYMYYLVPEVLKLKGIDADLLSMIKRYYSGMPIVSANSFLDRCIEKNLKDVFRYITNPKDVAEILEMIYINRQVVTLIHSNMVCKMAMANYMAICYIGSMSRR